MAQAMLIAASAAAVLQAFGQYQAGQERSAADKSNASLAMQQAALARQQADQERAQAAVDAANARTEARRAQGARISSIFASGFALAGTPLEVLADAAATSEQNALTIQFHGAERARALLQEANIYDYQANEFQRQAEAERQAGIIGAGGTLLSSGAQIGYTYSQRPKVGTR